VTSYDVIIIGSGAGGGTLARTLASQGRKILVIERGDWVERSPVNWDAAQVFQHSRYVSPDPWLNRSGRSFQPGVHYNVGGATKFYGAALYRMREHDFTAGARYGGTSPAWPLSYEDLESYYATAERWYHVHGDYGDPSEPHRDQWYYPRLQHEPVIAGIAESFTRQGLHPSPAPCGVILDSTRESRCIRCDSCDGFPCPLLAKADAETCGMRPAIATGNVDLLTGVWVKRLIREGSQITSLSVQRSSGEYEEYDTIKVNGATVVLAAGAVNSAAIWLRSNLPDYSQQAGRNYMSHSSQAVLALGRERLPRGFHKTLAVNDFYLPGEHSSLPLGSIQMAGQPQAAMLRGESKTARLAPGMSLREIADHSVVFWLMSEDLPRGENRVTVGGQVRLSVPVKDSRAADLLYAELAKRLPDAGFPVHLRKTMGLDAVAHQCGTLRMGENRDTSVVNPDLRAWDTPNLYLGDSSVFPSSGAVNPALTVMALAIRLGHHLTREG